MSLNKITRVLCVLPIGIPGCGKTTLISEIVKRIMKTTTKSSTESESRQSNAFLSGNDVLFQNEDSLSSLMGFCVLSQDTCFGIKEIFEKEVRNAFVSFSRFNKVSVGNTPDKNPWFCIILDKNFHNSCIRWRILSFLNSTFRNIFSTLTPCKIHFKGKDHFRSAHLHNVFLQWDLEPINKSVKEICLHRIRHRSDHETLPYDPIISRRVLRNFISEYEPLTASEKLCLGRSFGDPKLVHVPLLGNNIDNKVEQVFKFLYSYDRTFSSPVF